MRRFVLLIAGCLLWVQFLHPVLHMADRHVSDSHSVHCTLCQESSIPTTPVVLPVLTTVLAHEYPVETPRGATAPTPSPRGRAPPLSA